MIHRLDTMWSYPRLGMAWDNCGPLISLDEGNSGLILWVGFPDQCPSQPAVRDGALQPVALQPVALRHWQALPCQRRLCGRGTPAIARVTVPGASGPGFTGHWKRPSPGPPTVTHSRRRRRRRPGPAAAPAAVARGRPGIWKPIPVRTFLHICHIPGI